MDDDQRLKRVLKRYRKSVEFCDASMDLPQFTLAQLQGALGRGEDDPLMSPIQLGDAARAWLSAQLGMPLDSAEFDYFLHVYVRRECLADYYSGELGRGPTAPSEDGPPLNLLAKGMAWASTRPKDGKENWMGVPDEREEHRGPVP